MNVCAGLIQVPTGMDYGKNLKQAIASQVNRLYSCAAGLRPKPADHNAGRPGIFYRKKDGVRNPYAEDFSHAGFVSART